MTDVYAGALAKIRQPTPPRWRGLKVQLGAAILAGTGLMLGASLLLVGVSTLPLGFAMAGYVTGAIFALRLMNKGFPYRVLGGGNLVTLARMALVAALLAPTVGVAARWALVGVATLALVLDGVDGWLARREGRVSAFGSKLDMEVDSALALIMALHVWLAGVAGPLILLLGLPRYAFVVAGRFLPWLHPPLPESFARKVVCVVQVASLIALNAPVMPSWFIAPVAAAVAGALLWSFGRDIIWLWRSRP
jgi:phosphatidylglycerophosphate synthase